MRILDQYQSLFPASGGVHPQAYSHGASAQVPDTQSYAESQEVFQTFHQESPDSYGEQAHISAYAPYQDESQAADQEETRQEPAQGLTATNEGTWSDRFPDHRVVPVGGHTLPPLPYAYDALEPHIDAETMRVHHDVLHKKIMSIISTKLKSAWPRPDPPTNSTSSNIGRVSLPSMERAITCTRFSGM